MLRLSLLITFLLSLVLLTGCQSSLMKAIPIGQVDEQLYVDAELQFSVQHPLEWIREALPLSSPQRHPARIRWIIPSDEGKGHMIIHSAPKSAQPLQTVLIRVTENQATTPQEDIEKISHHAGEALQLTITDDQSVTNTVAIRGQRHDFVLIFNYPRTEEKKIKRLAQQTLDSFREL